MILHLLNLWQSKVDWTSCVERIEFHNARWLTVGSRRLVIGGRYLGASGFTYLLPVITIHDLDEALGV